jgi:Xaa-Pro dipeptidase
LSLEALYRDHLATLDRRLADALDRSARGGVGVDGVIFHSGREAYYHADDHAITFAPHPHYRRWVPPQDGPEHVVWARPGRTPVVVRVQPADFWFDTSPPPVSHWEGAVELKEVSSFDQVKGALGDLGQAAFVGASHAAAAELGIDAALVEPQALMMPLDWHRGAKTPYELALLRRAAESGARAHAAARDAFYAGGSELEMHWAFLRGAGCVESELSFSTIMAFDQKSAILHYQHKRGPETSGRVFLADAGTQFHGYASDITRTWLREGVHPTFAALRQGLDALERRLVAMVAPGRPYAEIHVAAHHGIAELLVEHGVARVGVEEALASRLTRVFMPHGVGHQLGLQVHDVGGHQATPEGGTLAPPDGYVLRNTRRLEPGHVVTIEPGLYFIPMLLEPLRHGPGAAQLDWDLVDALTPHGGIRIEDNVACTDDGFEDLTRPFIGA